MSMIKVSKQRRPSPLNRGRGAHLPLIGL